MQRLALGQLGWAPQEFWDATPREFWNALEGNYEREQLEQRQAWERTRWQTCFLLNIQLKKDNQLAPKDLIVFPWEKDDRPIEVPTDEDMRRILERDKKIWQNSASE